MHILHITTHMGDGLGKAISGLAILGSRRDTHRILLLDTPKKQNHIDRCLGSGVEILSADRIGEAVAAADIVVLSWWGGVIMDKFLTDFPKIPCRVLLWSHKNGYYDPPLSDSLFAACDGLLATSPFTLENPKWGEKSALVYGFGDFAPEKVPVKTEYKLSGDKFIIGYVGMPGYKRFPSDCVEYFKEVIGIIPNVKFVMAGEVSEEFKHDIFENNLEKYFDFLGWVGSIPALLPAFDVFGYLMRPDISATTENSVIEAMAAALPCVVSKYPIGKYLLEDNVSGFLAENPEEYGKMIFELYSDIDLRKKIGQAGREHTMRQYCAEDNLGRFEGMCKRIIKSPKKFRTFSKGAREND